MESKKVLSSKNLNKFTSKNPKSWVDLLKISKTANKGTNPKQMVAKIHPAAKKCLLQIFHIISLKMHNAITRF